MVARDRLCPRLLRHLLDDPESVRISCGVPQRGLRKRSAGDRPRERVEPLPRGVAPAAVHRLDLVHAAVEHLLRQLPFRRDRRHPHLVLPTPPQPVRALAQHARCEHSARAGRLRAVPLDAPQAALRLWPVGRVPAVPIRRLARRDRRVVELRLQHHASRVEPVRRDAQLALRVGALVHPAAVPTAAEPSGQGPDGCLPPRDPVRDHRHRQPLLARRRRRRHRARCRLPDRPVVGGSCSHHRRTPRSRSTSSSARDGHIPVTRARSMRRVAR